MARHRVAAAELTPEKEAEAQELAKRICALVNEDIDALARLLVSKNESDIFGETEFQVRDIVHRMGAQAYEAYLAKQKRLPGVERDLPPLRPGGQVPGLCPQETSQFDR